MRRGKFELIADVLVAVEDSRAMSILATALDQNRGVRHINASSADDLIDRLSRERYDALVISETFYGLGYQGLLSLIRSGDLCTPNLPVILIADRENGPIVDIAKRYFVKPITTENLADICNAIGAAVAERPRPTVLVIDDNDHFLSLIADHLESSFRVVALSRPEAAADALTEARPDIVVCDYGMPFRDGESVARELRALNDEIPIVILTAHDTPENHIKLTKAGITRFLSKKTPFRELERALRDLILEYATARASRAAAQELSATGRLMRAIEAARNDLKSGRAIFASQRLKAALMRNLAPASDDSLAPEEGP